MTLFHLHHDDVASLARKQQLSFRPVLKWIGAAFRTLHQAIVSAKLRRMHSGLLYRHDYSEMLPTEQDIKKLPQRPMILGEKWDF